MSKFKDTIYRANQLLDQDLTLTQKKEMFKNAKNYILIQDLQQDMQEFLADGEEIIEMMPLTNTENTGTFTTGMMGMSYARTKKAKAYVKGFHTVRGNRLLMFTDRRILFLVPTDFFESKEFFSYPYESIKGIHLKEHQIRARSEVILWYSLDFQSGAHVFTETLTEKDKNQLLKIRDKISKFNQTPLSKKVVRKGLFDKIFANLHFSVKLAYLFNFVWFALLAIIIAGLIFGIGPLAYMRDLW